MDKYKFGYPKECRRCAAFSEHLELKVKPYFKPSGQVKLMLIGQDPTIREKPERVKEVLMLDDPSSQLSRWLKGILGDENFGSLTIYATNVVKCSFKRPPSETDKGGLAFLKPYFQNCKDYLTEEILLFQPAIVLALGEPAHNLTTGLFDNSEDVGKRMKDAFTGDFRRVRLKNIEFDYSPCLHIQTFRVAETYGEKVKRFKEGINEYFKSTG